MTQLPMRNLLWLVLFSLLMLTSCHKAEETVVESPNPHQEQPSTETWQHFITRQIEEHVDAHPQFAVVQGRHEYDGQLPDWGRAGIEKEVSR